MGKAWDTYFEICSVLCFFICQNRYKTSFSGSIPPTIQQCKKLYELRLSENLLTGSIPSEIGSLTELQVILDLSRNHLSGEIPSSLGKLLKLERLNLSFNHLQGDIPSSLGKLTSLDMLNMSNNHLQGELPPTFSGFPVSSFSGNDKLCGPPLSSSCTGSAAGRHENNTTLSSTAVVCIVVAIVFTSAVICLVMIYIMLRMWCNWRKVSISNSLEGATGNIINEQIKREEEQWMYGSQEKKRKGEYWRVMNSVAMVPSRNHDQHNISSSCIFHVKMDTK